MASLSAVSSSGASIMPGRGRRLEGVPPWAISQQLVGPDGRIGHSRGRPVAHGFGKCGVITSHSASVRSVWYLMMGRLCWCRVIDVHMGESKVKEPLRNHLNTINQPISNPAADKSPRD